MVRGKLHVDLLPEDFPGESAEGAAIMVGQLPRAVQARFPNSPKPKIIMTDRGRGFFNPGTGHITPEYDAALKAHGLRAFQGQSAADQPGSLSEVLLHETAVSWLRLLLSRSLPKEPWKETREQFGTRLREAASLANKCYDVDGLCRRFPCRIEDLIDRQGDRLRY